MALLLLPFCILRVAFNISLYAVQLIENAYSYINSDNYKHWQGQRPVPEALLKIPNNNVCFNKN